jgi:hypothetical protein
LILGWEAGNECGAHLYEILIILFFLFKDFEKYRCLYFIGGIKYMAIGLIVGLIWADAKSVR